MNDSERNRMIEKIRKVLALSSSPNEAEAMAAASKAQAMLAEYNLTMADVAEKEQNESMDFIQDDETVTDSVPWRRGIASQIAKLYFCTYYYVFRKDAALRSCGYIRRDTHYFVGLPHNVYVAKMMFKYLGDTVERLAAEGTKQYKPSERSKYQTSFKWACSGRLQARIMKRIEEAKRGGTIKTESGTTLPALADLYTKTQNQLSTWLDQNVGEMKETKKKVTQSHMGGVLDGQKAGDSIGLDTQLPGSAKKLPGEPGPKLLDDMLNGKR